MVDYAALNKEASDARTQLRVSWRDFALVCKAKMVECAIMTDGISSYSIGGRTVTRDLSQWQEWYEFAMKQAASEEGGVMYQDIAFVPRGMR